jgi:hypothetical protein
MEYGRATEISCRLEERIELGAAAAAEPGIHGDDREIAHGPLARSSCMARR